MNVAEASTDQSMLEDQRAEDDRDQAGDEEDRPVARASFGVRPTEVARLLSGLINTAPLLSLAASLFRPAASQEPLDLGQPPVELLEIACCSSAWSLRPCERAARR